MTEKIQELKPKLPPALRRINDLQKRVDSGSKVYAEMLGRSRMDAAGAIAVDLPALSAAVNLMAIQFNALVNVMQQMGVPAEVMLKDFAEAIERATGEIMRQSILSPIGSAPAPPAGNIQHP